MTKQTEKAVSELLASAPYTALDEVEVVVSGIAYASNKVQPGDLFFCVVGTANDGHIYASDAVSRGAKALVVERPLELAIPQFVVADSRSALAYASAVFFDDPTSKLDVIGITGTNGKTTTSYLLEWVLRSAGRVTGLLGTVEWRVADTTRKALHTTPESFDLQELFAEMVESDVDTVVMEVSSHAIDLNRIAGTDFKIVAFTNLTQDHLDYHHGMEDYYNVKESLFLGSDASCVICIDDDYGKRLFDRLRDEGRTVLSTGFSAQADVRASRVTYSASGTELSLVSPQGPCDMHLSLVGRFNVENALLACGIALQLGIPLSDIAKAFATAPQVPGRLERMNAKKSHDFSVLVDYAHTPDAVEKAIEVVKSVTQGRTLCVFGCGGDRDRTKRPLMGRAALTADYVVVTSDNPRSEDPDTIIDDILVGMEGAEDRLAVIPDRRIAIRHALLNAKVGDSVLIAGKGHEDYQIVGSEILPFDDRLVAAEELDAL
ncbi:MAG: UDP-N-acetylmuramoyl-L-alanyl-D-glutamate--2,6-diaminopimelate ligase [Actinobacteria bacterium]|nr:UDP-N-acetylmuramoyl-L-alanyl-D-glutamate--2,6-diaminopimelate ligase [Actinomycetota bacterium]